MFSASCLYGLQAMFYIALRSTEENYVSLNEIADEQKIPRHFLSKILQILVKHKLLISMKGPNGGFRLVRRAESITLIEIVEAIDGLDIFSQCGIGFKVCDESDPCPIHNDYKKIRARVYMLFHYKSLDSLTEDIVNGDSMVALIKPASEG